MLAALYESSRDDPHKEYWSFKELAETYDIDWQRGGLLELQKELLDHGLIRGPSNASVDEMAIGRLSGLGLREIEREHGTLKGVPTLIVKPEQDLVLEDGTKPELFDSGIFDPAIFDTGETIHSAAWTGLPRAGTLDEKAAAAIICAISEAETKLSQLDAPNAEKAQMHAYLLAIRHLAEAPDPPADLIWTLISRAADITSLMMVVAALVGMFS